MSVVLSPRLQQVAVRIKKCYTVMDVGCDHGLLTAYILEHNLAEKVIASDISEKSLDKAKRLIGDDKRVSFRVGDGLNVLCGECPETVVIAGMGGLEIERIIKNAPYKPDELLLVPHRNTRALRSFLTANGYKPIFDKTVADGGRFYDVVHAVKGSARLNVYELEFGITNLSEPNSDFTAMLKRERDKFGAFARAGLSQKQQSRLKLADEVLDGCYKQ